MQFPSCQHASCQHASCQHGMMTEMHYIFTNHKNFTSRNASVKKWAFLVARAIYNQSKMAFSIGFADV